MGVYGSIRRTREGRIRRIFFNTRNFFLHECLAYDENLVFKFTKKNVVSYEKLFEFFILRKIIS